MSLSMVILVVRVRLTKEEEKVDVENLFNLKTQLSGKFECAREKESHPYGSIAIKQV